MCNCSAEGSYPNRSSSRSGKLFGGNDAENARRLLYEAGSRAIRVVIENTNPLFSHSPGEDVPFGGQRFHRMQVEGSNPGISNMVDRGEQISQEGNFLFSRANQNSLRMKRMSWQRQNRDGI